MRRQRSMGDLLRNQRKYRRKKPRLGIVFLITLLGAGAVFWFFVYDRGEGSSGLDDEAAVAESSLAMGAAVDLARVEVEAEEDEAYLEEALDAEAQTAVWEEGRAVRIAGALAQNESVFLALQGRNISGGVIHNVVTAMGKEFNFRRSRPGDQWQAEVDEAGVISSFRYQTSPEDIWNTTRTEDGSYETVKEEILVERRIETIAGAITSSFWVALESAGESGVLAYNFMDIFSYTIDFNTETRGGDRFAMVFEKIYLDGKFLRYGKVLGATYEGRRTGSRMGFYHETRDEKGYWEADGESLQRQFLRSPLPFTRITSRFGRRTHPVLGGTRMHAGVDYGAPIGTPVQAVADGTVTFAGWQGGYGKFVSIRHSGGFETRYAHLSVINVKVGNRVSRGKIFARTGNTGRTTGPHLHFEMKKNGRHVDPLTVKATQGEPLKGKEFDAFTEKITPLMKSLQETLEAHAPSPPAAMAAAGEEDDDDD
ncbi:MAG: peptidoglycan DD-metalloendopeptidase family protein [Bradymonadaceae bacterium]